MADTIYQAVLRSKCTIEQLLIFLASEERRFVAHPYSGDDMVLNEPAKRFP
jgi:hypothetical protein